jgi:hypothetical protein
MLRRRFCLAWIAVDAEVDAEWILLKILTKWDL